MGALDPTAIRPNFPALSLELDGRPVVYFDGPGGTQVPQRTIDAVSRYFRECNANEGGAYATSEASDRLLLDARFAVSEFLGAAGPDNVKFGYNMTTLTFHASRSIGAMLSPGDEILVTALDHEANVSPWHAVAAERQLTVRTVGIVPDDCTLDLDDFNRKLNERTRVVAFGYASNAVGTVNPVRQLVDRAHAVGALAYVDAVHYAPHGLIDFEGIGADLLACSAYKWFGPHLGILCGKRDLLDRLPPYKVRPAHDVLETGTPNLEAIAGTLGTLDYLASLPLTGSSDDLSGVSLRSRFGAAMSAIAEHESRLAQRMLDGLGLIPGIRVWGIRERASTQDRTPTFALTLPRTSPREIARRLGATGIFTWDGDFYARALIERLGLAESGGVLRVGIVHYNTEDEVDRFLTELDDIAQRGLT